MRTDLFDYELPAESIAQHPRPRGTSRLLVLDRGSGAIAHRHFAELPDLLRPGDVLVRNDVRVRPARLYGRDDQDRLVEIFLLRALDEPRKRWLALAKPGRRAKAGRTVRFDSGITAAVLDVDPEARRVVEFDRAVSDAVLDEIGHVPLPPYIRREPGAPDEPEDRERYQTVYARDPLAVAAPTAGLHFSRAILDELARREIEIVDLTLAVGAGTFKPVTASDVALHNLDSEEVAIPRETTASIRRAREEGRRIVAVGTTVTRALEAWARRPESEGEFSTDLFITPGFEFRVVGALLTNFHLPRSTLLMLVCAFAGRENVLATYEEAIRERYLFYSYGDAMLVC
ncbi:MAG TPA: tRNA preQ1(34) S-adenosylmethionine ribosyltransferase-isomerase QueA [Thermoanaerobaculia bacterium]